MNIRHTIFLIFLSVFSGIGGSALYHYWWAPPQAQPEKTKPRMDKSQPATEHPSSHEAVWNTPSYKQQLASTPDLREASKKSTNSVVYIKTYSEGEATNWMDVVFFGYNLPRKLSSGSGVIFSEDGHIITNKHVIENADRIEVIHKRRSWDAELVGVDPNTDIAVLKVEEEKLPAIAVGNSREIQVGDWVLAVGNPFNLTSTVTAGIVSAKGRHINLLKSSFPLESFIQTDAAINPGNSGGALVNMRGELVGINTAILSNTGSYAGYGFAVPSNIVKKVVEDLIKYKEVQKAFINAEYSDLDEKTAEYLELEDLTGVVIGHVSEGGAADEAGLQKGDVIIKIDGYPIKDKATFEEELNYHRPGEEVTITYLRDSKPRQTTIQLNNREGQPTVIKREVYKSELLGARMEKVSQVEAERLRIPHGVRLTQIQSGLFRKLNITEGFIIVRINREAIKTPEQLEKVLKNTRGRVILKGVHRSGEQGYYTFYI